jgi:YHS domain-containing protein
MESEYTKKCPNCSESFEAKRRNQKFCSPDCKMRFNNRNSIKQYHERKQVESIVQQDNKILYQNREILSQYIEKDVSLAKIEKQGFVKGYVTAFKEDKERKQMMFACYDVCYYFTSETMLYVFLKNQKIN